MKILIFSDIHIHKHKDRVDRLDDCLKVLNWVYDQAISNGCEAIAFLGDLFHERAKIDVLNYLRTFEVIFNRATTDASHIEAYFLVGNHDMYYKERWDVNSIKPFSAIPNTTIIQSPTMLRIGGKCINWLPHTENPLEELDNFKNNNEVGQILFGHMAVHGAMLNTFYGTSSDVIVEHDNEMKPVDAHCFDDWDMTVLGHYHGAQQISDKVEYIGSPLELGFGEAFQNKHIMVLDLETMNKKYILNTFSPKHLIVSAEDIQNEAYNLDGNFIRLAVSDIGRKDLIDIKRKVSSENTPLSFDIKMKDKKIGEDDSHIVEEARSVLKDTAAMLRQYVEDVGVPEGLDKTLLLSFGEKCLEEIT